MNGWRRWLGILVASSAALSGCDRRATAPAPSASVAVAEASPLWIGRTNFVDPGFVGGGSSLVVMSRAFMLDECVFHKGFSSVSCTQYPACAYRDPKSGLVLASGALADQLGSASPHVVVQGSRDIVYADREKVLEVGGAHADVGVLDDGSLVTVQQESTLQGERFVLTRWQRSASEPAGKPMTFELGNGSWARIVLPWILVGELDDNRTVLKAYRIPAKGEAFGEGMNAASVTGRMRPLSACRTAAGVALAVGADRTHVLFERGGRWMLVEAGEARVFLDPDPVERPGRVDCDGESVVISWTESQRAIEGKHPAFALRQIACEPGGCESWRLDPIALPNTEPTVKTEWGGLSTRLSEPVLTRLGGKRLLVWNGDGGVFLRWGRVESGPPQLCIAGRVRSPEVFVRTTGAVVLANGPDQTISGAFVDLAGAVAPITK